MGSCYSSSVSDESIILSLSGKDLNRKDILEEWIKSDTREKNINEGMLRFLITGENMDITKFSFNFETGDIYRDNSIAYYKDRINKYSRIVVLEEEIKVIIEEL